MHNLHVRTAATDANCATAQKNRVLHLKNQINMTLRKGTRYFLHKLTKKGNVLFEQTAQALIRLRK